METAIKISHSTTDSETYQLLANGIWIGAAKKIDEGFMADLMSTGQILQAKTMATLKDLVLKAVANLEGLRDAIKRSQMKPYYITVDDARKLCCISHGGIATRLKELYFYHPQLHQNEFGAAIVKLHFETVAQFSYGEWEKNWLVKNAHRLPKLRKPDYEMSERLGRPVYFD